MNKKSIKKEEDYRIAKIADVSPLADWDRLFKEAKKNEFNAKEDKKDFADWDRTLNDGMNKI